MGKHLSLQHRQGQADTNIINEELHNLGCDRRASRVGWETSASKIVFDKAKGKEQRDRHRRRWNNNIKLDAT